MYRDHRLPPLTDTARVESLAALLVLCFGCGGNAYRYVRIAEQSQLLPPRTKLSAASKDPLPDCPGPRTIETAAVNARGAHYGRHGCYAQAGYVDLESGLRLRVTTPVVPEGEGLKHETAGGDVATGLTVRSNALGWETAYYDVKGQGPGSAVELTFVLGEQVIEGERSELDAPLRSKLDLPATPAHLRLYFLSRRSADDRDITLLSSREPIAGENIAERCGNHGVYCLEALPGRSISPYVLVKFNGREVAAPLGASLSEVLRTEGISEPRAALARLRVRRQWRGRSRDIAFEAADDGILSLPLNAGDEIRIDRR
jgi:hypothetical protein